MAAPEQGSGTAKPARASSPGRHAAALVVCLPRAISTRCHESRHRPWRRAVPKARDVVPCSNPWENHPSTDNAMFAAHVANCGDTLKTVSIHIDTGTGPRWGKGR